MSNFKSPIVLTQEQFSALTRIDKVIWSSTSFICNTGEPPPSSTPEPTFTPTPTFTNTTSAPPSTTLTPTSSTSAPPPTGQPVTPIITLSMVDKVIEIGTHKTLTINLQALTVGSVYTLEYKDFIKTTTVENVASIDYRNDSSIVLNGELLPMSFTATDTEMSIDIELHNPTGVKLFNKVYNSDDVLLRNIETCGKKKQTVIVKVGSRSASESIYMYFEKKIPTKFLITNVSTREIPRGARPATNLSYDLEIEGLADIENVDDFFDIFILMDQRRSGENGPWLNVPILKSQISGFELVPSPNPILSDKIIITFSKNYPQLSGTPLYSNDNDTIIGRTKLLELLYINDLERVGGMNPFNLINEKSSLIYQTLPIAITNSFSVNAGYDTSTEYSGPKFNQPLIDVETRLFNNPPAESLFIDKTDIEEYALVTNLGPTIEIQVDKTILPHTPGDNVATYTLTCSNLIVGKYYKLNYTMTANGAKHYAIPRGYNTTSSYFNTVSGKINLIGNKDHAFTSHMGNYPEFGPPMTEFDFSMMGDYFTINGTKHEPPRGFVATGTTQTFTFKIENKNGLIAFEKSKIKCTVGAIGIRAFIQPGFDLYRSWERFNGTIAGTSIGMVELTDAPMPGLFVETNDAHFQCGETSRFMDVNALRVASNYINGTFIAEDYTITSEEPTSFLSNGAGIFSPNSRTTRQLGEITYLSNKSFKFKLLIGPPVSCHVLENQFIGLRFSLTNIRLDSLVSTAVEPFVIKTKACCPGE